MLHITVDTSEAEADLRRLEQGLDREIDHALRKAGRIVQAGAKKRCPKGPTKAQAVAGGRSYKRGGPGGLERSITLKQGHDYVDVGVMSGEALKYAAQMHDGTYNLGPGSKTKQNRHGVTVGAEFLDRAYEDQQRQIRAVFNDRADVAVRRAG